MTACGRHDATSQELAVFSNLGTSQWFNFNHHLHFSSLVSEENLDVMLQAMSVFEIREL